MLLTVEVTWDGDYYQPDERAAMAERWIRAGLHDRSDVAGVKVWETYELTGKPEAARLDDLEGAMRQLGERVEATAGRLQSTLDTNELWDGS